IRIGGMPHDRMPIAAVRVWLAFVAEDDRPRVIDDDLLRHAGEMMKRMLMAGEHRLEPLMPKRFDVAASRVAEREDEDMRDHGPIRDPHLPLAKIDLRLASRGRLEADRRALP